MRDMELDHIALIVSKEENLAFYKKLGFTEKNRIERGYDTVVFMENGALLLEVFIDPNHPARVTNPEALGLRHIAFVVESLKEVMRDVECEEIRTDWFGRRFTFTKDPDGQLIELKEKNTPEDCEKYR
ncbi:MAG: VOC family protein [Erysipelotrichaceae bacterium]